MSSHFLLKASIIAGFLILSSAAHANDLQRRQSELKTIQHQISAQQLDLRQTSKQREKLQSLLRRDEKAVASVAKKVNKTKIELAQADKKINELEQQQGQLEQQKQAQQETLSKQLASAYLTGNHDYTKMILNQQNPATIERLLAYYQYLNKARIDAIDNLKQTQTELDSVEQQQIAQKDKLNKLMLDQQQQAKQLTAEQHQRQQTLQELQRTLTSKGAQLEQLQIEEASLKHVIDAALKAMKHSPAMDGLARDKGRLNWPTKGRITHKFGSQRSGVVTWKGVVISAPEGNNIRAIAGGKVIYADWLRGFGMVIVIDHGKGYMSLYGHAQALLKSAGDTVSKGQAIALVGRSGGQSQAGLYFEVRHKGQAINPAKYCR